MVELLAAMVILIVLASVALEVGRVRVIRARESELRRDLRQMREAIDQYKRYSDAGMFSKKVDTFGYPSDLNTLVEGEPWSILHFKYKLLRRIPVDPMTGTKDWGLRSMQDDPDSQGWGGQNVFDVYSKSDRTALDGTRYSDW